MTGREIILRVKKLGGRVLRQKGSHIRVECACGKNKATVPDHADVAIGTRKAIEKDLAPCLRFGVGWL